MPALSSGASQLELIGFVRPHELRDLLNDWLTRYMKALCRARQNSFQCHGSRENDLAG